MDSELAATMRVFKAQEDLIEVIVGQSIGGFYQPFSPSTLVDSEYQWRTSSGLFDRFYGIEMNT